MIRTTSRPLFIVFEGLDGAGKTTCASHAAAALGAELLTTPSPRIRACRDQVLGDLGACQEAAQLFYLSTVFAACAQVRTLLAERRSVVMDRYFLSTQVYAQYRGSTLGLDCLQDLLVPADLTVYLDAPLAVRKQRIAQRDSTPADRETLSEAADAQLRALYTERRMHPVSGAWLHIDSATIPPAEVTRKIARAIRNLAKTRSAGPPPRCWHSAQCEALSGRPLSGAWQAPVVSHDHVKRAAT